MVARSRFGALPHKEGSEARGATFVGQAQVRYPLWDGVGVLEG